MSNTVEFGFFIIFQTCVSKYLVNNVYFELQHSITYILQYVKNTIPYGLQNVKNI
jgi:hypothetical protein